MRALLLAPLGLALLVTACGETTGERTTTGAAGGAATGAVVGGPVGAVVGGGIGAVGGAYRPEADQYVGTKTEAIAQNATSTTTGGKGASSGPSNDQVREAQNALQKMGYYHGKIDGLYGTQTVAAVRDYQAKENLKRTGTLDRTTMEHLRNDVASSGNPPTGASSSGSSGSNAPSDAGSSSGSDSGPAGGAQMNK